MGTVRKSVSRFEGIKYYQELHVKNICNISFHTSRDKNVDTSNTYTHNYIKKHDMAFYSLLQSEKFLFITDYKNVQAPFFGYKRF